MSRTRLLLGTGILTAVLLLPAGAFPAPPAVAEAISYQGVLLDGDGDPRTGPVDLTLRIYDALSGGVLVYKQGFTAVLLTDGAFAIRIGPAGAATDSPADPATTVLAAAFVADLPGVGVDRFLELTVGSEGALGRIQVFSAPFALHSDTADVADTAVNAANLNGLDAFFVTELFEHTNTDGSGPPNSDPAEGLGDTDGDAVANFVDTDNDNDTLGDSTEVSQGSNINLVTPIVSGFSPSSAFAFTTTLVTVLGQNFQPGLTVFFGSQNPTAQNVTPASFEVPVGPQPIGSVPVSVTLPNGETDGASFPFGNSVTHEVFLDITHHATLSVLGTTQTVLGGGAEYGVDTDGDGSPEKIVPFVGPLAGVTLPSQLAVTWDPNGDLVGIRCRQVSSVRCDVELYRDTDGDFELEASEATLVEIVTPTEPRIWSPSLAFDPAGHLVGGYVKIANGTVVKDVTVIHDLDGDGQIAGAERRVIEAGVARPNAGKVAVDPAGRVVYAYGTTGGSGNPLRVAYDRSGDGDFDDAPGGNPELFTAATLTGTPECVGAAFDPAGRLAVVYSGINDKATLLRDLNGDGAFGAGETTVLESGQIGRGCDATGSPATALSVAYRESSPQSLVLVIDRDDDGDFTGANEKQTLATGGLNSDRVAVAQNAAGVAFVANGKAAGGTIHADPIP